MLLRLFILACLALLGSSPVGAHGTHQTRLAEADARIASQPGNPDFRRSRAVLYLDHRDYDAAVSDLERAEELDPGRPLTALLRGRVELARGRPAAASAALARCLSAWPEHPEAHLAMARASTASGDSRAAAHHYERALQTAPVATPAHYLGLSRALAAAGRPDQALASLDEGMRRLGPLPALTDAAIALELERGTTDAALARLDRDPERARADRLFRRGEILERDGRRDGARLAYRAALSELASRSRQTPALRKLQTRTLAALARLEP